jgi:predicted ArsR family transcriptional regulator
LPADTNATTVAQAHMLLPVFRDLIKPQWRTVLEELKLSGGLPVSELARCSGGSYMAVKTHCEELTKAGYLIRTRLPRTEVGRPEIFYSLSTRADALFPEAGAGFSLELLEEVRRMYGESAPEKILFQYFEKRREQWAKILDKLPTTAEKALKLAALRQKEGCASECECEPGQPIRILEIHNPLQRIFEKFPRAPAMEARTLEQLLGGRVTRHELPGGRQCPPRIVFEIS